MECNQLMTSQWQQERPTESKQILMTLYRQLQVASIIYILKKLMKLCLRFHNKVAVSMVTSEQTS